MWKWFMAIAENIRLNQENIDLRLEINILRRQLFEEINSNREREDSLVRVIAGAQHSTGRPNLLSSAADAEPPEEEDEELPELVFGEYTKEMVDQRARDYMAEAARSGTYYDFNELCKAIEANPQEFLSN
jgi:hypothetical protein